jgi:hypothetical protein
LTHRRFDMRSKIGRMPCSNGRREGRFKVPPVIGFVHARRSTAARVLASGARLSTARTARANDPLPAHHTVQSFSATIGSPGSHANAS